MSRPAFLIWLTLFASVSAWSQSYYYFPFAADGSVSNGSLRTSILISNPGKSTAKIAMVWTKDDGSARLVTLSELGRDSKFSFSLAPKATRILQTDGSGSNPSGAALIASDQTVGVWGILSAFDSSGVLRGETGFAAAGISPRFRIPVDATLGLNTGIALYNPGPGAASVAASLVDSSGAAAGSRTITLAAGAGVTRFVSGDLFGDLGDFRGTLDLTSTIAVAAQVVRQSGASPVSAILEATPLTSSRLKFYLPQLADGPSTTATLCTTFLLTNLSTKPATVNVALARDDGSPWTVAIPGMDPNSTFQTVIAPGGSTFWQTDGAGPYATGAAAILSDRPIGVQALVTASDADGTTLSETAAGDAKARQQFTLPFDTTADSSPGAAFYNPGPRAVTLTLTLLDADGKIAGSPQFVPVAPGGRVVGTVADFFPGSAILRGALSASTGGPTGPFVSALGVRQNQSLPWSSTFPAGAIPLSGVPITVTTSVDDKRAVSADIGPKGGSLSLTDASGNKFNLTIPPSALFGTEHIVMTPVTAAKGMPGSGLVAVQLAPDGLVLLEPATLAIQPAAGLPPGTPTPVGWYGSSPGVYLNLLQPKATQMTLLLTHFSGGGMSSFQPGDLTAALLNIIDLQAYYSSEAAASLTQAKANGTNPFSDEFSDLLYADWAEVIEPLIGLALSSQDDDVIRCAMQQALGYERQRQLMGIEADGVSATISGFMSTGLDIIIAHAEKRCKEQHDFTALQDLLAAYRQAALLGSEISPDISALQQQCPAQLQLEFTSQMVSHLNPIGDYKGQVSAKFPLTGEFDKTVLTAVNDPSKDLFATYLMSGFGPLAYDNFSFVLDPACSVTAKFRPGTMTVLKELGQNKSQIQFMFSAGYNPAPYSISGLQLCAFCPIYQKKPVKVELLMDPGLTFEDITVTCPGADPLRESQVLWAVSWDIVHPANEDGLSFITQWEFPSNHDPFAQKISTQKGANYVGAVSENLTIKLTRPTTTP